MLITTGHTLDVLLALLEDGDAHSHRPAVMENIRGVLRAARRYARLFPIGRPEVLLASGNLEWHLGRRRTAIKRWRRAIAEAARLEMPYETARAHMEIGRHLAPDTSERWRHLSDAVAIFDRLGCVWELARVRALQADTSTAPVGQESSVA
jgi:hypothetical protein